MPLQLIKVWHVSSQRTAKPGCTLHVVNGNTVDEISVPFQASTVHDLKASICQRGRETGRGVWIGWKDGRWGKEIVTVQFDDTAFNYDNPPAERVIR